jgi:hypothetical protein
MLIEELANVLGPAGLGLPRLNALIPNVADYKAMLFQPEGQLAVSSGGVANKDRARASVQFGSFLDEAHRAQADLVVCPEYSMPWDVLVDKLGAGLCPRPGELWVLGCESATHDEIRTIKSELEPLGVPISELLPSVPDRFVSPLIYIFWAPALDDAAPARLVFLVQFKTHPMSHPTNFEVDNLQCGTTLYRLTGPGKSIRLVSIICSDALDFKDEQAGEIYDDCLIIHIQLNKDPRNVEFRRYRDKLLKFPDDVTELLCLNWAADIVSWHGETRENWNNVAGSAWYSKSRKFDLNDATITANHRRGLYYTWLKPLQFHATFFNYLPAIFELTCSKVFDHQVAAISSRRRGPQLQSVKRWDAATSSWVIQNAANDGFEAIVSEAGPAEADLKTCWQGCPLSVERLLALTTGAMAAGQEWHSIQLLDSCVIDDKEVIMRMTFCQDTNTGAARFRTARLRRCRELFHIVAKGPLPPYFSDLKAGFSFQWSRQRPQQNVRSSSGEYATLIYLGEESSRSDIESAFARAADSMRFSFRTPDEILAAQQRLGVWYREDGEVKQFRADAFVKIDKVEESMVDVGRVG